MENKINESTDRFIVVALGKVTTTTDIEVILFLLTKSNSNLNRFELIKDGSRMSGHYLQYLVESFNDEDSLKSAINEYFESNQVITN